MRLLVKFPTRGRPEKALATLGRYVRMESGDHDVRYVVVLDVDDPTMGAAHVSGQLARMPRVEVHSGEHADKIAACNAFTPDPATWDVVLLASDDMIPHVEGWDAEICDAMTLYYPDLDGVLWFNDGVQGKLLNTLSIMGRAYYERFGYVYHPEYKSLCCDNEFMEVAALLGRQTYIDRVVIRHEHYVIGARTMDVCDERGVANHTHDWEVLRHRRMENFGLRVYGGVFELSKPGGA